MTGPSGNRHSASPRSIETPEQAILNLSGQIDVPITLETSHYLFTIALVGTLLKIFPLEILNFTKINVFMTSRDWKCVNLRRNCYQNMHINFVEFFVNFYKRVRFRVGDLVGGPS